MGFMPSITGAYTPGFRVLFASSEYRILVKRDSWWPERYVCRPGKLRAKPYPIIFSLL